MELTPLKRSAEYDDVERECKALFLNLYGQGINEKVDELALYGMPHIGPASLIERGIAGDGLAVLRTTTFDQIRYLFHAWRYKNPQRGTAFLSAYLRALFGPVFTIDQMWCKKAGEYPVDLMSEAEILAAGKNEADYFLTSRLRVDINTDIVPERILKAARTAVAARFVLELRAARQADLKIPIACIAYGFNVGRITGNALYHQRVVEAYTRVGPGIKVGGSNLLFSSRDRLDMQTFTK